MLDNTTKRNIDAARDVLVGKIPNPTAQVEQITTALIYKFMDDLDKESVELGGEARFFTGDYEKYSWTKLVDTRLTGEGRLDLYVQAITSMNKNPNLPQLFRDIFKGAFLPYNDPQTLSLFLKEINKFNYDHSEELGNAFEYLLSILGSQGDAGQFRTPRHIIDFMVDVIEPQKNETILDPACGTAGFLISSYKFIRKRNSSNYQPDKDEEIILGESASQVILQEREIFRGDLLTPAERKKLTENIQGYDISPEMVRLSLVNLYLHGFPTPRIYEYDTLTSEKHWGETFDVILANPPFMTPKGGIRPHKRFQVQAKRSEVLFVDYILEHLNVNGRAGIIVPEGIIFKNENAYKSLRKLLLEDGLYAVVSLPSGVFNPYAGVKTSILFLDNHIARQRDEILFIKVDNDGFDLGAQRRKIDTNDLPEALNVLQVWHNGNKKESNLAMWISKEKITKGGDYTLNAERYIEQQVYSNNDYQFVELEKLCEVLDNLRKPVNKSNRKKGHYPYYGATGILDYVDDFIFNEKLVLVGEDGAKWGKGEKTAFIATGAYWVNNHAHVLRPDRTLILDEFLVPILNGMDLSPYISGITVPKLNQAKLKSIKIPLPPLEDQKEIIEQIEVKQAAIDSAKSVIENLEKEREYIRFEIQKLGAGEMKEIGEICALMTGGTPTSTVKEYYEKGEIKWIVSGDIHQGEILDCEGRITELGMKNSNAKLLPMNSVLIALNGQGKTRGTVALLRTDATCNQSIVSINSNDKSILMPEYLFYILRSMYQEIRNITGDVQRSGLNMPIIRKIRIPLPSIEVQNKIVVEMNERENAIRANEKLIHLMEKKIVEVLDSI